MLLGMNTKIERPLKCSEHERRSFEALVRKGEEVEGVGLTERIRNAESLMFLMQDDGALIGVAALKRPNPGYRANVFLSAQSKLRPEDFGLELGWIYVVESERRKGRGHTLMETLLPYAQRERVYATTRKLNAPMICVNERYGFHREGNPYVSKNGQHNLLLFVR
jgi:RimJ/RimL family protein N-acetyltransferase